tara:strand:- start:208 stop:579 length:372 start_codon:yes stop_codon:yes gene_type:complete
MSTEDILKALRSVPIPSCFLFGQIVKEMRIEKRLIQQDLAKALDIKQSAYCKLETGVTTFNALHLAKIEDGVGLEPVSIFERYEKLKKEIRAGGFTIEGRRTTPTEIKELKYLFSQLSQERRL